MNRLEDINSLKQRLVKNNLESLKRRPISREQRDRAEDIIKHSVLNNTQDIFRYCSAINLMNSYVKMHKKEETYWFKSFVSHALYNVITKDIPDVTFCFEGGRKGKFNPNKVITDLTVVNVGGMQFSFHQVGYKQSIFDVLKKQREDFQNKQQSKYLEQMWEGVRLQPCAEDVFAFANNLDGLTQERFEWDDKKPLAKNDDIENE